MEAVSIIFIIFKIKGGITNSSLYSSVTKGFPEGIVYPLWYSWTSSVAQLVKNPPAKWETWV